jgi:hypothetical protein
MNERARNALLLGGLGLLLGCSAKEEPLTQLVLVVDSDLPTLQLEYVELVVVGRDGQPMEPFPSSIDEESDMPLRLGVVHTGGDLGPVEVTARGRLRDKGLVATRTHKVYFEKGKTRAVPLHLMAACFVPGDRETFVRASDPCADSSAGPQCAGNGECLPTELEELPSYPIDPIDKGPGLDGGLPLPDDGGKQDGATPAGDAGGDASSDAGVLIVCEGKIVNPETDPLHCGDCTTSCAFLNDEGDHLVGACVERVCTPACEENWGDCDSDPAPQCKTDLLTTKEHCGGCDPAPPCSGPNKECVGGECVNK